MDALLHLPVSLIQTILSIFMPSHACTTVSQLELNDRILKSIKDRYKTDPFIVKLTSASSGMDDVHNRNGSWFINDQLIILNVKHAWESLI